MTRNLGLVDEVRDANTGYGQTISSGRRNYCGIDLKVKFDAISKLDVTWLK